MKKQNIVIIAVIALVLVLAVGYALFSETLTIKGTATASANFDVEFTSIGSEHQLVIQNKQLIQYMKLLQFQMIRMQL